MNDLPGPWPTGRHATRRAPDDGTGGAGGESRRGVLVGVVVLLGVALATLAIVGWAGDTDTAPFEPGSSADVIAAAGRAGLQVCSVRDEPDPLARRAIASTTVRVADRCSGTDDATVVVDRYASAADRDAVARELTARNRPRGSGVVHTWRDMTILVRGDGDDDVRERLGSVLRGSGAR